MDVSDRALFGFPKMSNLPQLLADLRTLPPFVICIFKGLEAGPYHSTIEVGHSLLCIVLCLTNSCLAPVAGAVSITQ